MSNRKQVAVLISGSGTNLQALIDACAAKDFPAEIALIISNNPEAFGLTRAKNAGIATLVINHRDFADRESYDAALDKALREYRIEIVCLAGFMRLLTPGFTQKWYGRMLNIHPSLLPAFKGLNTHARALEAGVKFAGCTVHFVSPEMDSGPIIIQSAVPVHASDTPETLRERVLAAEHQCYPQALRWLAEGKLIIEANRVAVQGAKTLDDCSMNPK